MDSATTPTSPPVRSVEAPSAPTTPSFLTLVCQRRQVVPSALPALLLAVDPGETTGWCVFEYGRLTQAGQCPGDPVHLDGLITRLNPDIIVCEEYRIYGWKAKRHAWSDVPTLRLIGGIQMICTQRNIPMVLQGAQQAKGFSKDDKLRAWGLYQVGKRHANDSIRHATYYLLFGYKNAQNGVPIRRDVGPNTATAEPRPNGAPAATSNTGTDTDS
jgi:hypothetical protein